MWVKVNIELTELWSQSTYLNFWFKSSKFVLQIGGSFMRLIYTIRNSESCLYGIIMESIFSEWTLWAHVQNSSVQIKLVYVVRPWWRNQTSWKTHHSKVGGRAFNWSMDVAVSTVSIQEGDNMVFKVLTLFLGCYTLFDGMIVLKVGKWRIVCPWLPWKSTVVNWWSETCHTSKIICVTAVHNNYTLCPFYESALCLQIS